MHTYTWRAMGWGKGTASLPVDEKLIGVWGFRIGDATASDVGDPLLKRD